LRAYLEDASGSDPGTARGLLRPEHAAEAAAFLRESEREGVPVLPQAARSSLTAGAIPHGEVVLSVERLTDIGRLEGDTVRVDAGVRLFELQRHLAERGRYYPPVPTYQEAMLGGTAATNAGGAATFKYGVTRDWVRGIEVLLFNGDLLVLERGAALASRGGSFRIELSDGRVLSVPVPDHRLPDVRKISAGYWAADPLDLVDLFVGSEGTLGWIAAVTVGVIALPPTVITGLAFVPDLSAALALASDLRTAAEGCRATADPRGPDIRSIELIDGRSLRLVERHGDSARLKLPIPGRAGSALLFELELDTPLDAGEAERRIASFLDDSAGPRGDEPLGRLLAILERHGTLGDLELALPGDEQRRTAIAALREAVPTRLNEVLAETRRTAPGVAKVGGDMIVPIEQLAGFAARIDGVFAGRGLDYAVWGHLSDGNLHPNAVPRDEAQTRAGHAALLELAGEAVRLGGSPLSEHGVGRSPLKQAMLRLLLGDGAIAGMRRVKRALDPGARFAPGVLFPTDEVPHGIPLL
jgi:D-lactate dehydrogenase (cytochrome)